MPVTVEAPQAIVTPPHKLWTRDECFLLLRAGVPDLNRYELVEGALIEKMPKNQPHMLAVILLASWLRQVFGEFCVVTEPTIDLRPEDNPTSAPEPDVIVLTRSAREFSDRAKPRELHLVAEVSDSALTFDRTTKAQLYARSGIVEYWIVDINAKRVIVHREPSPSGYRLVEAYSVDEQISALARPADSVRVGDLLK